MQFIPFHSSQFGISITCFSILQDSISAVTQPHTALLINIQQPSFCCAESFAPIKSDNDFWNSKHRTTKWTKGEYEDSGLNGFMETKRFVSSLSGKTVQSIDGVASLSSSYLLTSYKFYDIFSEFFVIACSRCTQMRIYTFWQVKMTIQLSDDLQQIHQKEKHTRKLLYMAKKTEKERKLNSIPENPYPQSSCNKFSVDRKHWSWRIRPVRTDNVAAAIIMMRDKSVSFRLLM